jgi:hypothetical protein
MINLFRGVLRRTARPILLTVAVLYFLIDLIFLSVARPLRRRIELDEKIARMGGQSQPLRRVAVTACAVAGSGADQTTRFPPVLPQASLGCDLAHRGWRGRKAHLVRAAIRHDQTEADELPLVCMVLRRMASRD